jgi:ribosomal protein L11 methyltransferase
MDSFWIVTLFHFQPTNDQLNAVEFHAVNDFHSTGIEEFSLSEPEVDEILGDRSYSGGDLSQEVLDEVEETVFRRPHNYRFYFNHKEEANNFLGFVQTEFLCESQIQELEVEDWNAEWKKHYSPILVSEKLEIIPSWLKTHPPQSEKRIFIYPGMGFGTGSHETTFLCLKLFTDFLIQKQIKEVLDFGSGSGILGLSVFKFFPDARIDFYDIDPEANKNCYQNAEINDLQEHSFRLLVPDQRVSLREQYDVVFANILESILLLELDALVNHTRISGHLVLSGLLRTQVPLVQERYQNAGMRLVQHLEKGDWAALLFVRDQA